MSGRYNPASHGGPLACPDCGAKNAPADSEEYDGVCFDCGFNFETPVSTGDEITVKITDIHESGRGVGRLESGFIVLVSGSLPTSKPGKVKQVDVRITKVTNTYAEVDSVKESRLVDEEQDDTEDATDETRGRSDRGPSLGNREDFWGGS